MDKEKKNKVKKSARQSIEKTREIRQKKRDIDNRNNDNIKAMTNICRT